MALFVLADLTGIRQSPFCDEKKDCSQLVSHYKVLIKIYGTLVYAYQQIHGIEVPFRFQVAVKNKKPVIEHHLTERTTDQFQRMIELIKAVDSIIAAEHFLPNEGSFYCSGCPHKEVCKEWHRNRAKVSVKMTA
jgi:CRISPR/Cas system-associated exonuclease Cas4 (RecB family)